MRTFMKKKRVWVAALIAAAALSTAGAVVTVGENTHPASQPPTQQGGTTPFLPEYLRIIKGEEPPAKDHCADAKNPEGLLIPCDIPTPTPSK